MRLDGSTRSIARIRSNASSPIPLPFSASTSRSPPRGTHRSSFAAVGHRRISSEVSSKPPFSPSVSAILRSMSGPELPRNNACPRYNSAMTHPAAHTSAAPVCHRLDTFSYSLGSAFSKMNCSGALYHLVPL